MLLAQTACADTTFVAPAQANAETADPNTDPIFTQQADCVDFINENPQRVTCGFIELPVNHDEPAKGTVTLPMLIAGQTRSLTATPSSKAILIPGGGGPGASIGFGLAYRSNEYLSFYDSLRSAGFDLVILDQRGAGFAKPRLNCPETVAAFKDSVAEKQTFIDSLKTYRTSLDDCRTRLVSKNISLQDFNTTQSAKDYLSTMDKLPYQWWGVLATSYATVIAQEMQLINPSIFDRIVLDSPVAIDYQRPFTYELTIASLERILTVCEITRRCNNKYGDIKTRFHDVLTRLKQQPASIDIVVYNIENNARKTNLQVSDSTLLDMLILFAYSNFGITEIPWIINDLHEGGTSGLKKLATEYWHQNSDLEFASALSWMIHCKERQPMEETYLSRHPESYNGFSEISKIAFDQERLICSDWSKQPDNNTLKNKLISAETLIIAGDLDPVINRDDIDNTSDNFLNKQVMILPGTGHSVWFQSTCTRQNVAAFFSNQNIDGALPECKDGLSRFR